MLLVTEVFHEGSNSITEFVYIAKLNKALGVSWSLGKQQGGRKIIPKETLSVDPLTEKMR